MKKNIHNKNYWWIPVVVSIILVALFFNSVLFKTDAQKFYDRLKEIDEVESSVLVELKKLCIKALEEEELKIKDEFIYVNFIDGIYTLEIHVLTEEGEYQKYDIMSKEYDIELPYFIYTGGDVGAQHAIKSREVYEYLKYFTDVSVEHGSNTIYLQYPVE